MIKINELRLVKRLYSQKKSDAKKRFKTWDLTLEQFRLLVRQPCEYCGAKHSNEMVYLGETLKYNGLDRINTKGNYSFKNVVPCCRFCNSLRGSITFGQWAEFIDNVVENGISQQPYKFAVDIKRLFQTIRGESGYEKRSYYKR